MYNKKKIMNKSAIIIGVKALNLSTDEKKTAS